MAAVLAFAVDAGHLALHEERRPVAAALHATDRLVERAVAVVVLAALTSIPRPDWRREREQGEHAHCYVHHFAVAGISIASPTA